MPPTLAAYAARPPHKGEVCSCRYCLRHCVPFDQSIVRASPEMVPGMFQGGPALREILLVIVAVPAAPLSFLMSKLFPVWVTVKLAPDHSQAFASGPQR